MPTEVQVANKEPIATEDRGTFAYRAGVAPTTVDVPAAALLRRVCVFAGVSVAATIRLGSGDVIPVPAGTSFDEQIPGKAIGLDVEIGGTIQAFYVSWVIP